MARSKKQQTVSNEGAIANATTAVLPSSAAAPSRAALKDKVPAGNRGVIVQTMDEFATAETGIIMQSMGARLSVWVNVIKTYGHDIETLQKYPEMLRNKLAAQYGIDLSVPRKQWSPEQVRYWGTIKNAHLAHVNRVWECIKQQGAGKALLILEGAGNYADKIKALPKQATAGNKGRPKGSTQQPTATAETAEGSNGGKHPAAPAPASKPAPTGMQAMFAALTTLKADELTAVCLKAAEVLKAKDSSKPAQAFANTIARAYAAWEKGGIVQEKVSNG